MDRARKAMPIGNKKIYERHVAYCNDLHRKRLKEMKSAVDNKEPERYRHLRKNGKKSFLMEERYQEIEYENRLLLEKMSRIMEKGTFADNKNESLQYAHKSLNKDGRRRELMRITSENQNILRRIQQVQPEYDHVQWEEDAKKNLQYKKNICEYPPIELLQPKNSR